MTYKKTIIILLLIFSVLPTHKIHAQSSTKNIRKIIGENTPEFIAKPIIVAVNAIEKFRSDMAVTVDSKKKKVQNHNIEFYFFAFLSFIFNNKLAFYCVLFIVVVLVLRYLWHLIF